jgi:hypothetical protein
VLAPETNGGGCVDASCLEFVAIPCWNPSGPDEVHIVRVVNAEQQGNCVLDWEACGPSRLRQNQERQESKLS